jgi:hypothetical protein
MADQQPSPDPLEQAVHAFGAMGVDDDRPDDADVLQALAASAARPIRARRQRILVAIMSLSAAAAVLCASVAFYLLQSPPQQVTQLALTRPKLLDLSEPAEALAVDRLEDRVTGSQVIVVALAIDSSPAPPAVPGDLAESLIHFQVKRVLKGTLPNNAPGVVFFREKLADPLHREKEDSERIVMVRTSTAPAQLLGREWILFLSPDFMAGKHRMAACTSGEFEPTVQSHLTKGKK